MSEAAPLAPARPRSGAADLARIAIFAAVIAVLGLPGSFTILGPVPITAQTLGVMLAGAILGPWRGAASVGVFLLLTAIGAPLLAGGRGGIGVFLAPSAGYLVGWLPAAFVIGALVHAGRRRPTVLRTFAANVVGGILVVYAIGIPVQSILTRMPLGETALTSLIYLPGDLTKAVIATTVVMALVTGYRRAFPVEWNDAPRRAPRAASVDGSARR